MANQAVSIHKLSNSMTLVAERMEDVSSAAFSFLLPGGVVRDPSDRCGASSVLCDLIFRGAGDMDNRRLNESLDALGLQRSNSSGKLHCIFSGALLGENLINALEIYADVLTRAHLDQQQFELCRELALQSLESLQDDPRQKIGLLAREQYLPYPYGRPAIGKADELKALTCQDVSGIYNGIFSPEGAIISVAGNFDIDSVIESLESCFGSWQGKKADVPRQDDCQYLKFHETNEGNQVHIAVLYPSVDYKHPDYYKAIACTSVLSGGMGSRLFTEVREKRGLCYAVSASNMVVGNQGFVMGYVGSSPDKAQEALDVMRQEFKGLAGGITQDELDRACVGMRASLIMQGESSSSRASACAGDYFHLGRVRSLEEIEQAILSLTVDEVNSFALENKPEEFSVTTIGPKALS